MTTADENILVFAFRYALGRRSTAPGIVTGVLIKRWNDLEPHTQVRIQYEIADAIEHSYAGQPCDVETWRKILALPVKP